MHTRESKNTGATGEYLREYNDILQRCSRGLSMTWHERRHEKRDILGLASLGFFLVLVSLIWIITPNLVEEVRDFFEDFKLEEEVFPNVLLPAPVHHHPVVYTTIARFCFVFGLFQIFILVLRLVFREPVNRVAGTFSAMVFWLGAGFVANMLSAGTIRWFVFLGWIIVLIGLSLVIMSLVVLLFELVLRKEWKRAKVLQTTNRSSFATHIRQPLLSGAS